MLLSRLRDTLVLVCLLAILDGFTATNECDTSAAVMASQRLCKEVNEALLHSRGEEDHQEICKQVILLLKCTAANVTDCFDLFLEMTNMYFHSPYNCPFSGTVLQELQKIKSEANKKQTTEDTRPPSTQKPTGAPHPSTTTQAPIVATPRYTVKAEETTTKKNGASAGTKSRTGSQKRDLNAASLSRPTGMLATSVLTFLGMSLVVTMTS